MLQAVLSLCEGNPLSMHLIGDAVAVAAAVPQGPWLCDNVCGLKTHASCDGVLILQVRGLMCGCVGIKTLNPKHNDPGKKPVLDRMVGT